MITSIAMGVAGEVGASDRGDDCADAEQTRGGGDDGRS